MLIWIGTEQGQEGLPGIPARDLSNEEVARYGGAEALLATGLYVEPYDAPQAGAPEAEESDADDDER